MTSTENVNHTGKTRRDLPIWVAGALSLGTVGPTLAMSGNGQGLVASVGKAVPLVFLIGLIGVSLVGYSFVRLTRHLNQAGSAYALVGRTLGRRTGVFAGFAMIGAYVGFSIGCLALTASFVNAFLAQMQPGSQEPFQVPWLVTVLVLTAVSLAFAGRDVSFIAKTLLVLEGIGIIAMLVLIGVIVGHGGAPSTGMDMSVFTFSGGIGATAVLGGVVAAFLSWAGFEACASMSEETSDPGRNIPRALTGTLIATGVVFVVVMFAQTIGFGTDKAGLEAFRTSDNTLGDLADRYIGSGFALVVVFTATIAAFASHMATAATAGRIMQTLARDGVGPSWLGKIHKRTGGPRRAMWAVVGVAFLMNVVCSVTDWPDMGTGNGANDAYFLFAIAGSFCLMVTYLVVEVAALRFVGSSRFDHIHGGRGRVLGVVLPTLGAAVILVVLWFNVRDADSPASAAMLGVYWCAVGILVGLLVGKTDRTVDGGLAEEIGETRVGESR
ncbi:APC family permease [Streptomyces sp. NPDC056697]|uniref:APC family permease n=1 Tax=Streptomyces sp. NPDC056697 TaxID=3345915 RepID=UPI0036CEC649